MEAANEEFKKLLARSGWNQTRCAQELDLQPASVSRYVNDIDKPSPQTLRLFTLMLAADGGAGRAGAQALRDNPGAEAEIWRTRALAAESKLAELQLAMRTILSQAKHPSSETTVASARKKHLLRRARQGAHSKK